MNKKKVIYIAIGITIFSKMVLLLCLLGLYIFEKHFLNLKMEDSYCPFCDEKVLNYQKYYEDDYVIGLYSLKPINNGHCVIIPKRHVEKFDDLTDQEELAIHSLIKKTHKAASNILNAESYMILQKNGQGVGQSIPHVHFHYIPRMQGEKSFVKFAYKAMYAIIKRPISEKEMGSMTNKFIEQLSKDVAKEIH